MIQTRISLLRNKFFFLLGIIVFLSIFFVAITNFQNHEIDLQQKIEKLELQNEAMNKQVEEQQHAERQLYERTKRELYQKLREQKDIHEKEIRDKELRFNSLQQQYKILATKHDDLDQQCGQVKKNLSIENNELKRKLDEIKAQNKKTQTARDNDNAMWKLKYESAQNEMEKCQKLLNSNDNSRRGVGGEQEYQQYLQYKYRNYQLEQEIKDLKMKLHIDNSDQQQNQRVSETSKNSNNINNNVDKSFQEQIPVSDDHYKIPINVRNRYNAKVKVSSLFSSTTTTTSTNVNSMGSRKKNDIINSAENFQIIPDSSNNNNVLQQPLLIDGKSSSRTTTTTTPTSAIKKENLALPKIKAQLKTSRNTTTTTAKISKKLPKFVLPIPPDLKNDDDSEDPQGPNKEGKKSALDETLNKPQNEEINELENGAHEINDNDFNDFNIEEKNLKSHFEDNLEQDKNMVNNAAEEFDAHRPADNNKRSPMGNEEMDLEIINQPAANIKDKLKDEIANDHGKEEAYLEDLHIEQQEDEGDIGEYDDPKALKQGIAERN